MLTPWKESYDHPKQHIKKQRYCFADKGPSSWGYGFSNSHVWIGELDHKETWVPRNSCFWTVVLEKTLESPLDCKEIQPVHPKGDQSWVFIGRPDVEDEIPTLATWCKELTHLKRPWCWERLRAGGEGDDRGWDDWMASSTWWTWVWVDSGSWWLTGKPGVLRSMGSQRAGHNWATELNWTDTHIIRTILRIPSITQRTKAFPHVLPTWLPSPSLMAAAFSCTWIHQQRTGSLLSRGVAVLNISIAPMLNPFIYTLGFSKSGEPSWTWQERIYFSQGNEKIKVFFFFIN